MPVLHIPRPDAARDEVVDFNPYDAIFKDFVPIPSSIMASTELTSTAKSVFGVLARFYNKERGRAWPKQETIAKWCGVSVPAVRRSLDALEKMGLIVVEKPIGRERMNHRSCQYHFLRHKLWCSESYGGNETLCPRPNETLCRRGNETLGPLLTTTKLKEKNTIPTFETPGGVPKGVDGDMSSSSMSGKSETPPLEQGETPPLKSNELHPRWKRWALKLHDAVFQRTHVDRKRHLSQWAKQLSLLHKIDKVSLPRIRHTLDWYCTAVVKNDDPYLPQGFSGQTFREKFAGIESKMNPTGKPVQKTIRFTQTVLDEEATAADDELTFFGEDNETDPS
jgi:hypothetical protein